MARFKLRKFNATGNILLLLDTTKEIIEDSHSGETLLPLREKEPVPAQAGMAKPDEGYSKEACRQYQADGLLVLSQQNHHYQLKVFNKDGSDGEFCGNGLRAAAYYLCRQHPQLTQVTIQMAGKNIDCSLEQDGSVSLHLAAGRYLGPVEVTLLGRSWQGYRVDMGNPHCIFFDEVSVDFLKKEGARFESLFPEGKTNVEFVHPIADHHYQVLVYERNVGVTGACGSGALALTMVLAELKRIRPGEKLRLSLLGGDLYTLLAENGRLVLNGRVKEENIDESF